MGHGPGTGGRNSFEPWAAGLQLKGVIDAL